MKKNKMILNWTMSLLLIASLASCSKPVAEEGEEHSHADGEVHSHKHESTETKDLTSYGFIKLKDHYFKLAPDFSEGEETHLDFYFKDAEGKHLAGADVQLNLIAPDSSKEVFILNEDEGGEHYHAKTVLKSKGKYQAIVQVKKNGEIYNPRFEFEV